MRALKATASPTVGAARPAASVAVIRSGKLEDQLPVGHPAREQAASEPVLSASR